VNIHPDLDYQNLIPGTVYDRTDEPWRFAEPPVPMAAGRLVLDLVDTEVTPFEAFPKIPRLFRECVVTEKIDGTNAQILITESGSVVAGSRSRFISPGKATDNFGFARWVEDHEDELRKLGPGRHFGEWWGQGINRGYGLKERRFSLFNAGRWTADAVPSCCSVVPVLWQGEFNTAAIAATLIKLEQEGSVAAPGFMKPEGVIVWHVAARQLFKCTIEKDEDPKGVVKL
jgi:hypothetical protein